MEEKIIVKDKDLDMEENVYTQEEVFELLQDLLPEVKIDTEELNDVKIDADKFKNGVDSGAGEIVVNSMDTDGVKEGFDLELLEKVCNIVSVPVIASGGAGKMEDFSVLFKELPKVDAGLAASVFHFGEIKIADLKEYLVSEGINVRNI